MRAHRRKETREWLRRLPHHAAFFENGAGNRFLSLKAVMFIPAGRVSMSGSIRRKNAQDGIVERFVNGDGIRRIVGMGDTKLQ